jgi:CRISPR-associated protein Cas1
MPAVGRIVEIAQDGRHLSAERGFLVVSERGNEVGRVPLDDVLALVVNAHGTTFSNNLFRALAERGAPAVLCGPNHAPYAWVWPLDGHHLQGTRLNAQVDATKPLGKRLWQAVVRAKIEQQGAALAALGRNAAGFRLLARQVSSGDPENLEAQAARRYWPLLFGEDFRRDRDRPGINALLNYGYTVLRSATARAVCAAGLHPTIGLHHRNRGNEMALVDDLMEPFRPVVDLMVARLASGGVVEVSREAKQDLARLTAMDMRTDKGRTPLGTCLERLALSVARSFENSRAALELPLAPLPLEFPAVGGGDVADEPGEPDDHDGPR